MRDTRDVRAGARVAGEIFAVFERTDPRPNGLPGWQDLAVPDDRLVASTLLLKFASGGDRLRGDQRSELCKPSWWLAVFPTSSWTPDLGD